MKKIFKLLICNVMILILILSDGMIINVYAENQLNNLDYVFSEEKVEILVEKANNMEISSDSKLTTRVSIGTYPTRKGVILVTDDAYKGVIKTGHSAIIYSSSLVVEANEPGVEIGPNDWNTSKDQTYAVTVNNVTAEKDSSAANYCYSQLSKPYNWNFYRMDYRDKFYCSHLIRSAYLDLYDIDLNTSDFDFLNAKAIHPMELVNSEKTTLIYRKN